MMGPFHLQVNCCVKVACPVHALVSTFAEKDQDIV